MRCLLVLLCVLFVFDSCRKEITDTSQQKSVHIIGSSSNSVAYKIITLSDGGYALTGFVTNSKNKEIFVSKFSAEKKILWTKTYGEEKDEEGRSIIELKDGGFLVGGYTTSYLNESITAYLIRIDRDGNLLWHKTYPHKASPGAPFNYDPLMLDQIHSCTDGSFNLYLYNGGQFRTVAGKYSIVRGQNYQYLEKIDVEGNSLKNSIFDIHIPGHIAARKSNIFGYPEQGTGSMKILEIALEPGNFTQPIYYFWNGKIDEINLSYTRMDSITIISGSPFLLGDNVWGYLFGLNIAISPSGGMVMSFVQAHRTYLVISDINGKNVSIKNFPGYMQGMNISQDGKIALTGVNDADGSPKIMLLDPAGNLLWTKEVNCKTQFIGSNFFGSAAYWGSPSSVCFSKTGQIMAAFTIESPNGGKTDISVIHLNEKGEIKP